MNDNIYIQVQDLSGNYRTYRVLTRNDSAQIKQAFRELKFQFPDSKMRAVTETGSVVDFEM